MLIQVMALGVVLCGLATPVYGQEKPGSAALNLKAQRGGQVDARAVGDVRLACGRDSWSANACIVNEVFGSNGNPNGPAGKICLNVEGAPGHTHWARNYTDGCGSSPATMGANDNTPCQGWGFTIGTRPTSP